ncbi:hypothetical protein EJ08DRAFT_655095 [Tothia fuscella]|uniref:Uncharacterized protein n=1 Tax=Tothia fuscella TaxID=1048955 RepID=A0A9P4U4F7_9PEZI|nr:hypothetical protein EJ08DRAFT_655095 [Tothia fuscella]
MSNVDSNIRIGRRRVVIEVTENGQSKPMATSDKVASSLISNFSLEARDQLWGNTKTSVELIVPNNCRINKEHVDELLSLLERCQKHPPDRPQNLVVGDRSLSEGLSLWELVNALRLLPPFEQNFFDGFLQSKLRQEKNYTLTMRDIVRIFNVTSAASDFRKYAVFRFTVLIHNTPLNAQDIAKLRSIRGKLPSLDDCMKQAEAKVRQH